MDLHLYSTTRLDDVVLSWAPRFRAYWCFTVLESSDCTRCSWGGKHNSRILYRRQLQADGWKLKDKEEYVCICNAKG